MAGRKKGIAAGLLAGLLVITLGCGEKEENQNLENEKDRTGQSSVQAVAKAEYPQEPGFKDDEERLEYRREKEIPEAFQEAYRTFAYKTSSMILKQEGENAVYSPLGLYYALAGAAQGAEGKTGEEMRKLLGYSEQEALSADCKQAFEAIYHVPNEENRKTNEIGELPSESAYTLQIANSLWADESLELKEAFADRLARDFYADVYTADLQKPETAAAMAEWVRERTNGRIVPEKRPAAEDTLLSLCNTIYFYDEWMDRFPKENTEKDEFTVADGSKVTCDFMNRTMGSHGFRKGENYTMSSLSLKNGNMVFVLPDEGTDVHELVKNPEVLKEILEGSEGERMGEVVWKVPKFSYGSQLELAGMLKELGMEGAFRETEADFSGISGQKPLFLSAASQNSHVGIDENGVEAASFTQLSWCGAALPQGRAEMILNRPFLYVIKNRGQLLFVGICQNPGME